MSKAVSMTIAGALVGVIVACAVGAFAIRPKPAGSGNAAGVIVLKLAHGLDEQHPVHQAMLKMKARLEELTHGRATLNIYSGGVLGNEVDCLEQVQKGELAMTKVSVSALEAFLPEMKVFSIPFAFRDHEHFWKVLNGSLGKRMLKLGIPKAFMGLTYYDSGDRNFYSTAKPIRTVNDIKNMKVRVMSSRSAMDMIRAMGGSPCPISWGELYTALSQGTVDAAENNWPSFVTSRHYEVCKYFTLTAHQRIPDMVIISTKVWDRLPPAVQKALRQAAEESTVFQRALWEKTTEANIVFSKSKGIEVITPDVESFRKACASIIDDPEYASNRKDYQEIQEVK